MKVKIDFLPEFMRLAKPLWKKYASFEQDYMLLLDELRSNPFVGTPLGEGVRKVRMSISSKGKGKYQNVSDEYIAFLVKEKRK